VLGFLFLMDFKIGELLWFLSCILFCIFWAKLITYPWKPSKKFFAVVKNTVSSNESQIDVDLTESHKRMFSIFFFSWSCKYHISHLPPKNSHKYWNLLQGNAMISMHNWTDLLFVWKLARLSVLIEQEGATQKKTQTHL